MGVCSDDSKKRKENTWGHNKNEANVEGEENKNLPNNEDIIEKRNQYYQSKEFQQKAIFNNPS